MKPATKTEVVSGLETTIYDNPLSLMALRPEWSILQRNTLYHSGALSLDYVLSAWRAVPKRPGTRLAVIVVRRDGAAACIWPLYVFREGAITVATHLGYGANEEYAGPLLREVLLDREAGEAALTAAKSLADVLRVWNLFATGGPDIIVSADQNFRRTGQAACMVISSGGIETPDQWFAGLSSKLRAELRQDRRKLSALGALETRRMAGPEDGPRCASWIIEHKRDWLKARGISQSWVLRELGEKVLADVVSIPASEGVDDVEAYALTLDGKTIAAAIVFNGPDRMEYVVAAFDAAYNDKSPGNLLIEDCVRLAIQREVKFDFRQVEVSYKRRWADSSDLFRSYMIACSPLGVASVMSDIAEKAVRRFRARWGPVVRGWLSLTRPSTKA